MAALQNLPGLRHQQPFGDEERGSSRSSSCSANTRLNDGGGPAGSASIISDGRGDRSLATRSDLNIPAAGRRAAPRHQSSPRPLPGRDRGHVERSACLFPNRQDRAQRPATRGKRSEAVHGGPARAADAPATRWDCSRRLTRTASCGACSRQPRAPPTTTCPVALKASTLRIAASSSSTRWTSSRPQANGEKTPLKTLLEPLISAQPEPDHRPRAQRRLEPRPRGIR